MLHDLRYSLRMMRLHPWFSLALVAALALGIGANTAVFTLVNAVLFKPLPFEGGERIVAIFHRNAAQDQERVPISYSDYLEYRAQASAFESLEASMGTNVAVREEGNPPEPYSMARVTPGFFDMLGVQPVIGRSFTPADAAAGAGPVILLSHNVWRDRYGRSTDVAGRTVRAGDELATIIGVMPEGFGFPSSQQLWMPLADSAELRDRSRRNLMLIGKYRDGISRQRASADLDVIAQRLAAEYPDNEGLRANVSTFHELQNGGPIRIVFMLMQGAVGFVLLITCANVANMMLSRALGRAREMSVRAAMGASRWRLVRQLLVEAGLLSLLGGALGLIIARFAVRAFEAAVADVGKPSWIVFGMNYMVFVYFAAACLVSAVLFGLVPGLASVARRPERYAQGGFARLRIETRRRALGRVGRVPVHARGRLARRGQACSFVGSLEQRASLDGLPAAEVLSASINLPQDRYPDDAARSRFYDELLTNLEGTPGLRQAALVSNLPTLGAPTVAYHLEGEPETEVEERPSALRVAMSASYLDLLDVPILAGRFFDDRDGFDGLDSIIVTSDFAARVWPGQPALGKRLRVYSEARPPTAGAAAVLPQPGRWLTVVGVAADLKQAPNELRPLPLLFVPHAGSYGGMTIVLRSSGNPAALAAPLRAAMREVDPDRALANVRTLEEASYQQGWYLRVFGTVFLIFAGGALLLASIGIYAVVAQTIVRRTQEIGIRMAMGATSPRIQRLVVGRGLKQLGVGTALGLAIALVVTRLMGELLYGVSPTDPAVFSSVVGIIALVGLLACWLPARRAAALHPLRALRHD